MVGAAVRAQGKAGLASPPGRVRSRVSHDGLLARLWWWRATAAWCLAVLAVVV